MNPSRGAQKQQPHSVGCRDSSSRSVYLRLVYNAASYALYHPHPSPRLRNKVVPPHTCVVQGSHVVPYITVQFHFYALFSYLFFFETIRVRLSKKVIEIFCFSNVPVELIFRKLPRSDALCCTYSFDVEPIVRWALKAANSCILCVPRDASVR